MKAVEEETARRIEAEVLARLAEVEAASGPTGLLQPEPEPELRVRDGKASGTANGAEGSVGITPTGGGRGRASRCPLFKCLFPLCAFF